MESDADYVEEAAPEAARSRSPSPPSGGATLPPNVLLPERDFILTFETLPELWDTTNPAYTNKYKRNENLAKLLPILKKMKPNASVDDVKKKINTIRSNYRRELKKILTSRRSGAGAQEVYTPKIWYFPYLHFLKKLEQPVALDPTGQSQTTAETEQSTSQQSKQELDATTEKKSFSSVTTIPKPSAVSSYKRKKAKHEELLDRACQFLSEPCSKTTESHKNTNPIALEWSDVLNRLEPIQRLYAKKAINDVLFEAELGNLKRDSVKINESHSYHSFTPSPGNNSSSLISPPPPPSPSSPQADSLIYTATPTVTSPPPPSPASQQTFSPIPLSSNHNNPQQHTGPAIGTISENFTSVQRGTASEIILNTNYHHDQPSQRPALNSNEYILHIPNSPTDLTPSTHFQNNSSNNIVSLFTQFQPEY